MLPLLYVYNTDTVKDRNGDKVPIDASINSVFYGAGYSHVTTKKVLGGLYGFTFLFPVGANNRFQSKKEDSENTVGNQLNLEGGLGGDFLKGGLTVGLAYYAAFKTTDDEIAGLRGILIRGKNKSFAFGPEASLALAAGGKLRGFLTVRYFWETYARTATQGSAFLIQATFLTQPIKLP